MSTTSDFSIGRAATAVRNRPMIQFVLWALLAWVALFWRLGEPTFWDPDEAHYAVTTRELLTTGDWLAPTYNGEPFFDKPILFHQLQAIAMTVSGSTELGARLVPALAALTLIGAVWWFCIAIGEAQVGFVAALLLTMCPAVVALARYAILDMLFTAFLFGGAAVLTVSAISQRERLQYLGYVLIALAVLTKGPLGLVLTGLTFVAAVASSRDARRAFISLHWIRGALLIVGLAAPWFLYMHQRFGDQFVQGYVLNENLLLFSRSTYANQPNWTFYLQIVAVGMLPWTPVLVGRLYDRGTSFWKRAAIPDLPEILLWIWTFVVLAFFTLSQFKLDHYVFPVAPALCVLIARSWKDARRLLVQNRGVRAGFMCVGPILMLAGVAIAALLWTRFELPTGAWSLPAAWVAAGMLLTLRGRSGVHDAPWVTSAAFAAFYVVAILYVVPALERQKVVADVARWAGAHAEGGTQLCTYRLNRWNNSMIFYADRSVTVADSPEQFMNLSTDHRFMCVMPKSGYDELRSLGASLTILHGREGLWATSGRALWRSKSPRTNFLVVSVEH